MAKFRDVLRMGVGPEIETNQVDAILKSVGTDKFLDISKEIRIKILREILKTQRQFIEHHRDIAADGSVSYRIGNNDVHLFELNEKIIAELFELVNKGRKQEIKEEMLVVAEEMSGLDNEDLLEYRNAIEEKINSGTRNN